MQQKKTIDECRWQQWYTGKYLTVGSLGVKQALLCGVCQYA